MTLKNQVDENLFNARSHKQKKPRSTRAGFVDQRPILFFAAALGCFQRIDLRLCDRCCGNMGRQVAVSIFPFQRRLGARSTVPLTLDFCPSAASIAGFHDRMAKSTIIRTSFCGHQSAFLTFAYGITNQSHHPLVKFKKSRKAL